MVEGGGAHLGSSLPMSIHVRALSSSLVHVCFRSQAVAFVHGGWLHSCTFAFIRGQSCLFLSGLEWSHSFLSVRVVFMGGHDVGEVWWWWAVGGWWWWLLLVAVHGVVAW